MTKQIVCRGVLAVSLFGLIAACGGGGGDAVDNRPPPPPPVAAVQTGVFKDSNVAGISYASGDESGTTGTDGRYLCETGRPVTFSVGAVELGSTECTTLASPPALTGDGTLFDISSANMTRFLQMLDADENPDNGILITEGLQAVAGSWPDIDFAASDFDAEIVVPVADIMSVEERMASLPPESLALAHLEDTLSCAYSGVFIGQLAGDSNAAVTLAVSRNFYFTGPHIFWSGWDPEEGSRISIFPYDITVPPAFDSAPFDSSVQIDGRFDTPDSISGSWNLVSENASGTFSANRIGGDSAETRLTGEFFTTDGGGGVVVLDIDGSTITGEAFEATEGTLYSVTGTLTGDELEITATGGGETINGNATVRDRDANGLVEEIYGDLDVGGNFYGSGCKLN